MKTKVVKVVALVVILGVLLKNMWLGDDIFLTMRTLDNFVNGFGLVWNVGERVQIYTHPLWMLILLPFYYFIESPYVTLYLINGITTLSVLVILLFKFAQNIKSTIFMTVAIITSASFIDYSSSGLENSLSHLISLVFLSLLFQNGSHSQKKIFLLSLCASAGILTRYDTLLIYFPPLAYQIYENRQNFIQTIKNVLKGFIPVVLWEAFSLVYYGFLFPNTYYAKALTGLSLSWKINNGINYFSNSIEWDPITLLIIFTSIALALTQKDKNKKLLAASIILYFFYIIFIGGDFMAGRFFSNTFLIGLVLVTNIEYPQGIKRIEKYGYAGGVLILLIIGLQAKTAPLFYGNADQPNLYHTGFISNEKAFYYELGFLNHFRNGVLPDWGQKGVLAKKRGITPLVKGGGLFGYYAGPEIYLIDPYVLADPLRARLPVENDDTGVGHYWRRIPIGYKETIENNFSNQIENQHLKQYYDKLSLVIHNNLFTTQRFIEIIKLNSGTYDHLIKLYMSEEPENIVK